MDSETAFGILFEIKDASQEILNEWNIGNNAVQSKF